MTTPKLMRVWFAAVGTVLWTGIYLTGFSHVHWLIYLPAASFIFAAATGICPGQAAIFKMFGVTIKETPSQ